MPAAREGGGEPLADAVPQACVALALEKGLAVEENEAAATEWVEAMDTDGLNVGCAEEVKGADSVPAGVPVPSPLTVARSAEGDRLGDPDEEVVTAGPEALNSRTVGVPLPLTDDSPDPVRRGLSVPLKEPLEATRSDALTLKLAVFEGDALALELTLALEDSLLAPVGVT